jgi:ATP-binding cassette subfamily C protein CydCD
MDRRLIALAGPIGSRITVSVVLGLVATACYVAQGLSLAFALATLFSGGDVERAIAWVVAFAVVVVVRGFVVWLSELAAQHTAHGTKAYLREKLLAKLLELGPGYAATRQTGDLQAIVVAGVEALETYYSRYLPAIFIAIIGCGGVLLCLAAVDWRSAVLLSLFVVALPLADKLWLRWRRPSSSGIFAAMGAFGAYLLDSLQGIVTLKAFDAAARRRADLARRAASLRREAMTTLSISLMRSGLTGLIGLGGVATVLAVNGWRVADGTLAPIALFMTLFLAREAFRPLERLEREFHTAWSASGAVRPIADLLAAQATVREPSRPKPRPSRGDLAFEGVTFAYGDDDAAALSAVSFAVKEREFVALVGPSGAGKSTIIALLLRFYDPGKGAIRIGGVDIKDLALANLRALISVVSQDIHLFHGSISENLRIAKPDASEDELRDAARAAHIGEFIESLPQGYATEVGERGTQLSGGQRQRIALARALLKNAPILVLDEATSSVDPASERAIQQAFDTQAGRRTTLVIAHRLSTIRRADRILVLDAGKIVEQGGHEALAASGGLYSKLTFAQGDAA